MRKVSLVLAILIAAGTVRAQEKKPVTLRDVLLTELRSTHGDKDWFVPVMGAVKGLTVEQANWKDGKGNHSAGQLTYHLLFWNKRSLMNLKGEKPAQFNGKNDETFDNFDAKKWEETVKELDAVLTELENWVQNADGEKLQKAAKTLTNISTHNAYHTGQIIFVRKEQGSWDPEQGVK